MEVVNVLTRLGLEPIVLQERPNQGKTIIEKFEANSENVGYAVVLLTPDDVGKANGEAGEPKPRARQNVVMELGYFIGALGRERVCALKKAEVEIPSDIHGVAWVDLDDAGAWKLDLCKELKAAGYDVDANRL